MTTTNKIRGYKNTKHDIIKYFKNTKKKPNRKRNQAIQKQSEKDLTLTEPLDLEKIRGQSFSRRTVGAKRKTFRLGDLTSLYVNAWKYEYGIDSAK